jgi:hypothetical protein
MSVEEIKGKSINLWKEKCVCISHLPIERAKSDVMNMNRKKIKSQKKKRKKNRNKWKLKQKQKF